MKGEPFISDADLAWFRSYNSYGYSPDCPWCKSDRPCIACSDKLARLSPLADKEYKRQFPDGPQPIATFKKTEDGTKQLAEFLGDKGLAEAIMALVPEKK